MQYMNDLKVVVSFLLGAAMAASCILVYMSSDPVGGAEGPWVQRVGAKMADTKQSAESLELSRALKKAAMDDRTVIITTINEAWAAPNSILDIFLESFHIGQKTEYLLNHLVIVALDPKAFERCKTMHDHCFLLTTQGVDFGPEKRISSPDYLILMWKRIDFLRSVLELGYNFIFTDADIMWFRNPFLHFSGITDVTVASDLFWGNPSDQSNWPNAGFLYVKSSSVTVEFYKYWLMASRQYPGLHDQAVLNIIKQDYNVARIGVQIRSLDTAYFGGFCQPSKDLNKVCTMHANCCVGIERKLQDLRILLDDWKNYTTLPAEVKEQGGFSWRVPDKCKA